MAFDLPDILESCRHVVSQARHVVIDEAALAACARRIDPAALPRPELPGPLRYHGDRDACANFTLLCDCLNFCFWSDEPWVVAYAGRDWTRTLAMLAGVRRAIDEDPAWLQPDRWRRATESEVRHIFRGRGEIPLVADRARVLNETGEKLLSLYDGRFTLLVEQAGQDAVNVVHLLARDFPSFRDVVQYRGQPVAFLKRAQICAADLPALWMSEGHAPQPGDVGELSPPPPLSTSPPLPLPQPPLSPQSSVLSPLAGLERMTVFADYRLPQLFRHWGIMKLTPALEGRIEARQTIDAGSEEEVEIRAATIVVGDLLAGSIGVPAWRLDYFLWEASHAPEVTVEHHRTRTLYY